MWKCCKSPLLFLALGLLAPAAPARGQGASVEKSVQAKCAAQAGDSPLRRLRVDGVTQNGDTAMVSGLLLRGGVGAYESEDQALKDGLERVLVDVLPGKLLNVDGVKRREPKDLPHVKLQAEAEAAGRDGVLLSAVRFDETGTAVLNARVGSDDDKAWLLDLAAKSFPELKFKLEVAPLKQEFVARSLQRKLSAEGGIWPRLLVERVRYRWGTTKNDKGDLLNAQVVVSGLHLEASLDGARLDLLVEQLWPELFEKRAIPCTVDRGGILGEPFEVPEGALVKVLQTAVSNNPLLDGVRVSAGLLFDADGKIILKGVLPSAAEGLKAELGRTIRMAAAEAGAIPDRNGGLTYARVIQRGALTTAMTLVPTNLLLTDLRGWAAENVDDALLSRLNFNPDGRLTLHISTADKDVDQKVLKEFQSRALTRPYFPGTSAGEFLANSKPFPGSLTGFLRNMVERDQKTWEGVLIERGFFRFDRDPRGVYTVTGLADRVEQPEALLRVILEQRANKNWSDYLVVTPDRVQMDVMPLAPMLDRLKRVCPGHSAFDHVEITGVTQHPTKGLVLTGDLFNPNVKQDLAAKAADLLLKAHPRWKRRARDGVKMELAFRANQGDECRYLRPYFAAQALAQFDLARAKAELASLIRHLPDMAEVWYLSAIYHLAVGDDELARRDLTRVILIENGKASATGTFSNEDRRERLNLVERIQGGRRNQVDRMEIELRRKIGDGASQIQLLPGSE